MNEPAKNTRWRHWPIDLGGLAVIALITAAAYIVTLKPILDAEAERIAREKHIDAQTTKETQLTSTLTVMRNQLLKMREAIDDSAIQLQSVSHLNRRLAAVTELAAEAGLQVNEIQPGGVVHGEQYETVPIQLAGSGDYPRCAEFINLLHQRHPDTGVAAFELRGDPKSPNTPASFTLSLVWYAAPTVTSSVDN